VEFTGETLEVAASNQVQLAWILPLVARPSSQRGLADNPGVIAWWLKTKFRTVTLW
jgi:hypothetical protein